MDTISVQSTILTPTHIFNAEDITDYSAITYFIDSKSVLKLEGPSATLYNNTNFASPDFNYPGTLTKDITIPLISGVIPQGSYILTTTTHVTKTANTTAVNLGTNSVLMPLVLDGNFYAGQSIVWAGGANAGTYTVNSATTGAFGVTVIFVETLISTSVTGTLTFDEVIVTTDSFTYCYTAPSPVIIMSADCSTAQLTVSDDTNLSIQCEGQTVEPSSYTVAGTLDAPLNSGGTPVYAQTVFSAFPVVTTELWTQTWTASATWSITYQLPSGLYIETTITGTKSIDVSCDDSLCCMSSCIINATNRYIAATTNCSNINDILSAVVVYGRIQSAFMTYSVGVRCGDTTVIDASVAAMKTYLADTDCCNNCSDTGVSTQIVPIYSVSTAGGTVVIQSGDAYIDVSAAVVGSTTTYTLTLNVTVLEALIASYIAANPTIVTDIVDSMQLGTHISAIADATDTQITFDGTVSTGSPVLSSVTYAAGVDNTDVVIGEQIYHTSFPVDTYIVSVAANGDITMSQNSTTTGAITGIVDGARYLGMGILKYKRTVSGVTFYNWVLSNAVQYSIDHDSTTGNTQLTGDTATPGAIKFYGTDYNGDRGWQSNAYSLVENAGSNCPDGVTTSFALKTLGATEGGTWLINAGCQVTVTTLGLEPTTYSVGIFKNGSLINTRATYVNTPTAGASMTNDAHQICIPTLETMVATDIITLKVTPTNGAVTIANISVTFVRIA